MTLVENPIRLQPIMLSPESASVRENVPFENGLESYYSGEVTRASSPVDSEVTRGIDTVDPRLCQSTTSLSILSRYKVSQSAPSVCEVCRVDPFVRLSVPSFPQP